MYKITFSRLSHKQLKKLPMNIYGRVFNSIGKLMNDPATPALDITKLSEQDNYRLRVGDYRILYA